MTLLKKAMAFFATACLRVAVLYKEWSSVLYDILEDFEKWEISPEFFIALFAAYTLVAFRETIEDLVNVFKRS